MMTAGIAAALIGVLWIALAFLGVALFLALAPALGMAGAAAVTGAIALFLAALGAAFLSWRARQMERNALLGGLLSSGAVSALAAFAAKRPFLTLGLGGVAAALWARAQRRE